MKAKSSILLKTVCTVLFLVLTLSTILCGGALLAGVGFDVGNPEAARQAMLHAIADSQRQRVTDLLQWYTSDPATPPEALTSRYDTARTNARIRVCADGGQPIFDTLTGADVLYSDTFQSPYTRTTPLSAVEAGFSEADTRERTYDRFYTVEAAAAYRNELLTRVPPALSISLLEVTPDGTVLQLDPSARAIPDQTDVSAIDPLPTALPSELAASTLNGSVLEPLPTALPGELAASEPEEAPLSAEGVANRTVYFVIAEFAASDDSNAVLRSFASADAANAFRLQLLQDFPDARLWVDTVPELNLWIVHASLYQSTTIDYEIGIGFDRALAVSDRSALMIRFVNALIDHYALFGWGLALSALGAIACVVWLCIAAGHKRGVEGIHLNPFDRIPFDLWLAILLLLLIGTVWVLSRLSDQDFGLFPAMQEDFLNGFRIAIFFAAFCAWLLLALWTLLTFVKRVKAGRWWENTILFRVLRLVWRFIKWIFRGFRTLIVNLPLYWRTALVWGGLGVLTLLALLVLGASGRLLWLWLFAELILTPLVCYAAICLRRLEKGGEELASGNLNYRVPTQHMLPAFRRHAEHLNSITAGMQRAVHEQMKSERMKTELITNVSHDIKTPLTSIINYVKLLQRDGLQSENAPQYLEVLDRQSARLKKLTDDLVEASKASSGAMSVNLERTDLHVLLEQVLGEYGEKLANAQLTPVIQLCEPAPFVLADGKLLWRVFDNLFGNLCKYAQAATRVYLSTAIQGDQAIVTIKNVSRDPLNISGEELMERFVRGDAARNTDGSGLGLSIAQSLMALQSGTVSIDIDGDLFKVTLTLPVLN